MRLPCVLSSTLGLAPSLLTFGIPGAFTGAFLFTLRLQVYLVRVLFLTVFHTPIGFAGTQMGAHAATIFAVARYTKIVGVMHVPFDAGQRAK